MTLSKAADTGGVVPRCLGLKRDLCYMAAIAVMAAVVYYNALGGGFVFDGDFAAKNTIVEEGKLSEIFTTDYWQGYKDLSGMLYRPFTVLSFSAEYRLAGEEPRLYHLTNVVLHIANALLLYLVGRLVLRKPAVSFWAALLFALHPVQTEAVANIAGRADLLSMTFFMIALALYVKSMDGREWLYGLSLASFLIALLSKENAITLLGVLVCYDVCFPSSHDCHRSIGGALLHRAKHRYVGYVLVAVAYLLVRYGVLGRLAPGASQIGKLDNPIGTIAAYPRILTALKVALRYLMLAVLPLRLSADYSYNQVPVSYSFWQFEVVASCIVLAGVFAYWLYSYSLSKRVFFSMSFFLVTFSIVSNIATPMGTIMGERLLYLPLVGFAMALGILWDVLYQASAPKRLQWLPIVLFGLVASLYGYRSVLRNRDWRSWHALFSSAVKVCPNSAKVHFNLAGAYGAQKDFDGELVHLLRSLQIYPENHLAHSGLAGAYARRKWFDEAIEEFREALRIEPMFAEGHYNLGALYVDQDRLDEGIAELRKALQIKPRHKEAYGALRWAYVRKGVLDANEHELVSASTDEVVHYNRAYEHQNAGDLKEAILEYKKTLRISPDHADALINLGTVYYSLGLFVEALEQYNMALSLDPNRALLYNNIGNVWMDMKEEDKAIMAYRKAVACSSDFVAARSNLGSVYTKQGKWKEALGELETCLTIDPGFAPAYNNLGHLYLARGMPERAAREFRKALELEPDLVAARENLRRAYTRMGLLEEARALGRAAGADSGAGEGRPYILSVPANEPDSP